MVVEERLARDPAATPAYGERVPYVVISGIGNDTGSNWVLKNHVKLPDEFVTDGNCVLNSHYYISR